MLKREPVAVCVQDLVLRSLVVDCLGDPGEPGEHRCIHFIPYERIEREGDCSRREYLTESGSFDAPNQASRWHPVKDDLVVDDDALAASCI